jgi:hypothetical protein
VAQRLDRQWMGIDITHLAVALMKHRVVYCLWRLPRKYKVIGEPTTVDDAEQLAGEDPYQFPVVALGLVGARPNGGQEGCGQGDRRAPVLP